MLVSFAKQMNWPMPLVGLLLNGLCTKLVWFPAMACCLPVGGFRAVHARITSLEVVSASASEKLPCGVKRCAREGLVSENALVDDYVAGTHAQSIKVVTSLELRCQLSKLAHAHDARSPPRSARQLGGGAEEPSRRRRWQECRCCRIGRYVIVCRLRK